LRGVGRVKSGMNPLTPVAYCWGDHTEGRLGTGHTDGSVRPNQFPDADTGGRRRLVEQVSRIAAERLYRPHHTQEVYQVVMTRRGNTWSWVETFAEGTSGRSLRISKSALKWFQDWPLVHLARRAENARAVPRVAMATAFPP
jgi:hypothetical protein